MDFGSCSTNKPKETLAKIARCTRAWLAQRPTGRAHWPAPTQAGSRQGRCLDRGAGAGRRARTRARRQRRRRGERGAAAAGRRCVHVAAARVAQASAAAVRRRAGWLRAAGPGGPLVLAALSGGARAISGLSEFFHGRSRRWSGCSDLRSRGLLKVGGGVGSDGSLLGGGSRDLPCLD